jgi:hypothetical protein
LTRKRIPVVPTGSKDPGSAGTVRVDPLVRRYNDLNASIAAMLPPTAVAYDTIRRVLPLMRAMQSLLSQRPKQHLGGIGFEALRMAGRILTTRAITSPDELPSWTLWLSTWASELDYSVRHLRRRILAEPPRKYFKECGWADSDHRRAVGVASLGIELALAVKAGRPTTNLVEEIFRLTKGCPLPDEEWQVRVPARRRPAKKGIDEGWDLVA